MLRSRWGLGAMRAGVLPHASPRPPPYLKQGCRGGEGGSGTASRSAGRRQYRPSDPVDEDRIKEWFLNWAREHEQTTQSSLLVENEPYLRGDAIHRNTKTQEVLAYFRQSYVEPLSRGEIPYRLIDGKEAIKAFRKVIAETTGINFRDVDIIKAFQPGEVTQDVLSIINALLNAFSAVPAQASGGTRAATEKPVEPSSGGEPTAPNKEMLLFDCEEE